MGTPYLTRSALVSKRICRRVSCVPDILRVVVSALFKMRFATGVIVGTYFSFVRSPLTGMCLPVLGLTYVPLRAFTMAMAAASTAEL